MSQQDATTESGDSVHGDIEHSTFDTESLDVSGAPAVVTWNDGSDTRRHLGPSANDSLTLQIHRDASSNTAFLQLKASIALKVRRDRTNVFLAIHPDRIKAIQLVEDNDAVATEKLGTGVYGLRIVMNRPPALIVPPVDLTPKQKRSGEVLDSLRALTEQIIFAVHIPSSTLSKMRLLSYCEAVSRGGCRPTPKFTDVASLYGGKGGRIIGQGGGPIETSCPGPDAPPYAPGTQSPPSYDEISSSAPQPFRSDQKSGIKRRRMASDSGEPSASRSYQYATTSVEGICVKIMERVENGFQEIGSRLDRMEQRLTTLESSVERHAGKLGLSIERVHARSSEQATELRDEFDRGLYDVRKETEDIITSRVEDEMFVAREQLEECVKDEMAHVEEKLEESLKDSLANANVSLDISWNR